MNLTLRRSARARRGRDRSKQLVWATAREDVLPFHLLIYILPTPYQPYVSLAATSRSALDIAHRIRDLKVIIEIALYCVGLPVQEVA